MILLDVLRRVDLELALNGMEVYSIFLDLKLSLPLGCILVRFGYIYIQNMLFSFWFAYWKSACLKTSVIKIGLNEHRKR